MKQQLKKILLYTENFRKQQQIAHLCQEQCVFLQMLKISDREKKVGELAGFSVQKHPAGKIISEKTEDTTFQREVPAVQVMPEVMIFSGFSENELDFFLGGYRAAGIAPVALKAMLTPYNFNWNLGDLIQELRQEHSAMAQKKKQ